jgi:hypothetical protein
MSFRLGTAKSLTFFTVYSHILHMYIYNIEQLGNYLCVYVKCEIEVLNIVIVKTLPFPSHSLYVKLI